MRQRIITHCAKIYSLTPENEEFLDGTLLNPPSKKAHDLHLKQEQRYKVSIKNLNAWFGTKQALKNINLDIKPNAATAIIGPSGCGKTTLIRCLNRMHEMTPGAFANGDVVLDKTNIYGQKVNPVMIKRRIG